MRQVYSHLSEELVDELLTEKTTYGEAFFVPEEARWNRIRDFQHNIGEQLNVAVSALEEANDTFEGVLKDKINFNAASGGKRLVSDGRLKDLINHFNTIVLTNGNFEFPDLLGAAYEYLIKFFADSAGKKGGEFYTPAEVVRLMVQLVKPKQDMSVYDPTIGSGGMLIQSAQYVEEQGEDPIKLNLFGQESNPATWAISVMNMILHNLASASIEYGDTLEEPLHVRDGRLRQFDRVLANPPFSQNYTRANMDFTNCFPYGFAPETGKKADLMFVQHMIASLKDTGVMATVMPHGVLFRGGKEKQIREGFVKAGIVEAIISLPPSLFYGTGIPACILVINKNKPDGLRNKVLFINADAEYAEGKKQNKLRPEDIEKIDWVYTHKHEAPKYSRLVDIEEIRDNDYNLNICRYVDNTPPPEPEDVRAHLVGGVPKQEVQAQQKQLDKFDIMPLLVFQERDAEYYDFRDEIGSRDDLKRIIEEDQNVRATYRRMIERLEGWWVKARDTFARLAPPNGADYPQAKLPDVRADLLASLKATLQEERVLDDFQAGGVFANWWDAIKYDLKTIVANGWHHTLIPDEYLIRAFFQADQDALDILANTLSDQEAQLDEAVQEVEYEPEEDEKVTPAVVKNHLTSEIKSLKEDGGPLLSGAEDELAGYEAQLGAIKDAEGAIKKTKAKIKEREVQLAEKLLLKRYGVEEVTADLNARLRQVQKEVEAWEAKPGGDAKEEKARKSEVNKLGKDVKALEGQRERAEGLFGQVGGVLTEEEAKNLILQKHHDLVRSTLERYMDQERRILLSSFNNLNEKYSTSAYELEADREDTMTQLQVIMKQLNYTEAVA